MEPMPLAAYWHPHVSVARLGDPLGPDTLAAVSRWPLADCVIDTCLGNEPADGHTPLPTCAHHLKENGGKGHIESRLLTTSALFPRVPVGYGLSAPPL
jgi:hypothetical protein